MIGNFTPSNAFVDRSSVSFQRYSQNFKNCKVLDKETQIDLVLAYQQHPEPSILDKLIKSNMLLVVSVAKTMQSRGEPLVDLIQNGLYGICEAVKRFDVTKGVGFNSYAIWWIHQAMLAAIAKDGSTIRMPDNILAFKKKITQTCAVFEQLNGRVPTCEEIAEISGIELNKVRLTVGCPKEMSSLDAKYDEEDDKSASFSDSFTCDERDYADKDVEDADRKSIIDKALSFLPSLEREVLMLKFGLDGKNTSYEVNDTEISRKLGITLVRVKKLYASALSRLKANPALLSLIQ